MLATLLLAAMVLSCGASALAAEKTEMNNGVQYAADGENSSENKENQALVGDPPPLSDGYDYRNVIYKELIGSSSYSINVADARKTDSKGNSMRYGSPP